MTPRANSITIITGIEINSTAGTVDVLISVKTTAETAITMKLTVNSARTLTPRRTNRLLLKAPKVS